MFSEPTTCMAAYYHHFMSPTDAKSQSDAGWEASFRQRADVPLTSAWNPIGRYSPGASERSLRFYGSFDGQGYTLTDLRLNLTGDYPFQL